MNCKKLSKYYLERSNEFRGEEGHFFLLNKLKQNIKLEENKKTFLFDIGCNVGKYIQHILDIQEKSYDNVHIFLFEPNPLNKPPILEKIKNQNNIKLFEICLSDKNSIEELRTYKDLVDNKQGYSLAGIGNLGNKICDIKTTKLESFLDDYLKENNISFDEISCDFLKIDTEGHDTRIIKGIGKYLEKIKYIIFECSDCLDDERGPGIKNPMKDVVDFLDNNDFDVYRIGTKKLLRVNGEFWDDIYEKHKFWSNCFAIRKSDKLINKIIDSNFDYI